MQKYTVIHQVHYPQNTTAPKKWQDAQKTICKKNTNRTKKYDPHNQQIRQKTRTNKNTIQTIDKYAKYHLKNTIRLT